MNVLFWNLKGKDLGGIIVELVGEKNVDLLILAEATSINNTQLVQKLSSELDGTYGFHYSPGQTRLRLFSRFPSSSIINLEDSGGIAVRRVKPPGCLPLIMVAVHLPSQMYWPKPEDRFALCQKVRESLEYAEHMENHQRSFLVGDFNSDPYSDELINSEGLHAVASRRVAAKVSRKVYDRKRFFLYNPMWFLLGDQPNPPGSYYYSASTPSCHFWHLFDQVLLRPCMEKAFDFSKLHVVTSVGETDFLTSTGRPDTKKHSDHLPIIFSFDVIGNFANEG